MGLGLDAVRVEIARSFAGAQTRVWYDSDRMTHVVVFKAEGRDFRVSVSVEFDRTTPRVGCSPILINSEVFLVLPVPAT